MYASKRQKKSCLVSLCNFCRCNLPAVQISYIIVCWTFFFFSFSHVPLAISAAAFSRFPFTCRSRKSTELWARSTLRFEPDCARSYCVSNESFVESSKCVYVTSYLGVISSDEVIVFSYFKDSCICASGREYFEFYVLLYEDFYLWS